MFCLPTERYLGTTYSKWAGTAARAAMTGTVEDKQLQFGLAQFEGWAASGEAAAPIPPCVPTHTGEALRTRVLAVFHSGP